MKTHWKKLNNPDYIGAYSLMNGEEKNDLVVTIESVAQQNVTGPNNKQDECLVAQLKGQKPMILNATNAKTIASIADSPYIEDWVGCKVTLYVAKVKAFGDTVDALRIRPTAPTLPILNPTHPKWAGAKQSIADGTVTIEQIKSKYSLSVKDEKTLTDGK
jgi:hypothetical protein